MLRGSGVGQGTGHRTQGTGDVTILSSQGVGISSEQSYEAVSELELEREGCR